MSVARGLFCLRVEYKTAEQRKIRLMFDPAPSSPSFDSMRRETRTHDHAMGLIPIYSENDKATCKTTNARAETVATLPAFREAFNRRHCIVPAD
ncbi:SOS response-associated peptidase family protein [Granulicella sp. S190]|uniref:SOS response-associated peptidase family protein n=1 Tax=Granulicella sp. S190 TaxID=1747226 RepID=UPI00352B7829